MQLRELNENDHQLYHSFVAYHPQGSFLQSWEWGQWQAELGKTPHRFVIEDEATNEILLSAQILLTPVPYLPKTYVYIPYGPLVSMNLDTDKQHETLTLFLGEVHRHFKNSIFTRLEPTQQFDIFRALGIKTKNIQPARTIILDLNQNEEELLKQMHNKTRYNIKVAQRHGVRVVSEPVIKPRTGLSLEETVELVVKTSGRQNYKNHTRPYFKNFINFFGLQTGDIHNLELSIYQAFFGEKLLATALIMDYGRMRTYLFGGTSADDKNVMAPYLLHWQAILDAQKRGLECYDFYGIETAGGTTPGFVRFKLGFGGTTVEYPGAWDIVAKSQGWYTIYKILRAINRLRS